MKRKGFTLIELLAVIVILAIIALVATAAIKGIVEKARKGAAESSALGYIDAVEKTIVLNPMRGLDEILDGEYELPMDDKYSVKVKGSKPTEGILIIEKGKVKSAEMCINKYFVEYENGKAKSNGKCAARPQMVKDSLKVTLADGTEFSGVQEYGTPVKISFKVSVEGGNVTSVKSPEGATLNAETGEITYTTTGNESKLEFEISGTASGETVTGKIKISLKNYYETVIEATSLLKAVEDNSFENDSLVKIMVNGIGYSAHVYTYNSDLTISSDTEYGSASDVATSSTNAKNMVILKVNGNLTINEGTTLTTVKSTDGYGGPKGFLVYATGDITNNGTISMTARGAKAEGQDIYLWKNSDNSYEYVPSIGGAGASHPAKKTSGNAGTAGKLRQTGGGGSGASGERTVSEGAGSAGTSYSGGTGGTSTAYYVSTIQNGQSNGGMGGTTNTTYVGAGGAGNPGGQSSGEAIINAQNGTGGLLVLYANTINNVGIIVSNGSAGGSHPCPGSCSWWDRNAGGGSGAGSINIFYKYTVTQGTISVTGGDGAQYGFSTSSGAKIVLPGGNGGTGSIAIGKISNGSYTDTYHNWTN